MYLHLFKRSPGEEYGITKDSRGRDLPVEAGAGEWRYVRGVTVMPGDSPSLLIDPDSVLKGVEERGFHIWRRSSVV